MAKNEVLLVHSTPYDVGRDEDGNVMLYAASAKRPDRFPRSSVHFTANCEVKSHLLGSWGDSNKLIVANFEDVYDANGNPRVMSEVDTWYTLNPQEGLTLPNARVVEPSKLESGAVLERDGDVYRYHVAESYTTDQIERIQELASRFKVPVGDDYSKTLREISLRTTGGELGIDRYVDGLVHYSADQEFNDQYKRLAYELGVDVGSHDNTTEAQQENNFAPSAQASLEANRTLAWSGALTAKTAKQQSSLSPSFGGGLI